MGYPVDGDLFFFLASIAIVGSSLPQLRRLPTSRIPVRYDIREVLPAALTDAQAKFFALHDEKLAAMNYWPVCTYRIANYGRNLLRNYANPTDPARCVVMINEVVPETIKTSPTDDGIKISPVDSCTICFHTRLSDGTVLTTRNMQAKSILDQPPYWVVQECPGLSDPVQMKRVHDRKAATLGNPVSPPADTKSVFEDVQSEHQRFSQYELEHGSYELSSDGNSYELTDSVHWRAIANHLNPFAQNLSLRRFLPSVLVAIALPFLAITKLAPAAFHAASKIGFPPYGAANYTTLACFLVSGAVLGYLLERNTFLWTLFLTYFVLRVAMILPLGAPPDATFAATLAYAVAKVRKRHHSGLLSEPPAESSFVANPSSRAGFA